MGGGHSLPLDKRIVVVGGGYGGMQLCIKLLKDEANFTLIDATDSFTHCVAAVRAVVEPGIAPLLFVDYATTFKGYFKKGRVVEVCPASQEVVLEGGERVPYDVLVLATGCEGPFPSKCWEADKEEGVRAYKELAEKVKKSNSIAIIGGGPVGVEIAAEVKTDYPEKSVTLFHPNNDLLRSGLSEKFQKNLRRIVGDRMKVDFKLGEQVTNLSDLDGEGPHTVRTEGGVEVEADLVIKCTGLRVNSIAYKSGLESSMEERGSLKVNEYLQVEGQKNVFAIGDCTNVKEMKLVVTAEYQATCLYNNLKLMFSERNMKPYKADSQAWKVVISLGRNSGTGELKNGFLVPEFGVKKLKSEFMFITRYWGTMNQKVPRY